MSDRPTTNDGDDDESDGGGLVDAPMAAPADPFANLPKPRPGLEIRAPESVPAPDGDAPEPSVRDAPEPDGRDAPPEAPDP